MQIKTTLSYNLSLIRLTKIIKVLQCTLSMRLRRSTHTLWVGRLNRIAPMGNLASLYVVHCKPEALLLGIYPEVPLEKYKILFIKAICCNIIYNNKRLETCPSVGI